MVKRNHEMPRIVAAAPTGIGDLLPPSQTKSIEQTHRLRSMSGRILLLILEH
jgi:hypothetical protein